MDLELSSQMEALHKIEQADIDKVLTGEELFWFDLMSKVKNDLLSIEKRIIPVLDGFS